MDKEIKVSIITVVYNGARTIEQTIISVIKQTYKNVEYIIIDGGSTDGTCEIIKKYRDHINFFVSEADDGLYYAMNKGITRASGELIGIINCDDQYTPMAVSKVVAYYGIHNAEVIYGDALWCDDDKNESLYLCNDIEEMWYRMAVPHPATFVKKEVYAKYGLFNTKYAIAADYELMLRFYSANVRFGYVGEVLSYFRVGGLSSQRQNECIQEAKMISLKYIDKCTSKEKWFPKIQEYYFIRMFKQRCTCEKVIVNKAINSMICEKEDANIVIFGVGEWGKYCSHILGEMDLHIDFFVDNDPEKWEKKYYGIPVMQPDKLKVYNGSVLIASYRYAKEIRLQLMKINKKLNCFSVLEWAEKVEQIARTIK